jgi:membrane-associated phospholipid phosphatase
VSRARAVAAAFAAAFAALAGLVSAGNLTGVDRWAMAHAMPDAHFTGGKPTLVEALVPLWGLPWHTAVAVVTNVVTAPAAFLVACAIVAAACAALRNRDAVLLACAFVAGNVVEEITKETLTRPPLYAHGLHVAGFDNSFPSGHTIRTVFVAVAVAAAWPRIAAWALAWALGSIAMIELGALHVPSDIAGGLLLAGALLATTWSLRSGSASRGRRPSPASRPSARAR